VDGNTASPAESRAPLVDLLTELEAAEAADGTYEEVVLDGQLFTEIVSTLRSVTASEPEGRFANGSSRRVAAATAMTLIARAESEFLLAVGRALEHEETATHRKAAVQWAQILTALRAIGPVG
jgi:hypothetical protein